MGQDTMLNLQVHRSARSSNCCYDGAGFPEVVTQQQERTAYYQHDAPALGRKRLFWRLQAPASTKELCMQCLQDLLHAA